MKCLLVCLLARSDVPVDIPGDAGIRYDARGWEYVEPTDPVYDAASPDAEPWGNKPPNRRE